jgi:hypothetical protein
MKIQNVIDHLMTSEQQAYLDAYISDQWSKIMQTKTYQDWIAHCRKA